MPLFEIYFFVEPIWCLIRSYRPASVQALSSLANRAYHCVSCRRLRNRTWSHPRELECRRKSGSFCLTCGVLLRRSLTWSRTCPTMAGGWPILPSLEGLLRSRPILCALERPILIRDGF